MSEQNNHHLTAANKLDAAAQGLRIILRDDLLKQAQDWAAQKAEIQQLIAKINELIQEGNQQTADAGRLQDDALEILKGAQISYTPNGEAIVTQLGPIPQAQKFIADRLNSAHQVLQPLQQSANGEHEPAVVDLSTVIALAGEAIQQCSEGAAGARAYVPPKG